MLRVLKAVFGMRVSGETDAGVFRLHIGIKREGYLLRVVSEIDKLHDHVFIIPGHHAFQLVAVGKLQRKDLFAV